MSTVLRLAVIVAASVCFVHGQSSCTSQRGGEGDCISIYDCDELLQLVDKESRSPQELQFLQKSMCGYNGDIPKVCCPVECRTPEGLAGKCIGIYQCEHLAKRLTPPVSAENKRYVQQSICQGPEEHSVCCGPDVSATSRPPTPNLPNTNINAICGAKQSAFLPDPRSDCCGYESIVGNKILGGNETSVDQYPWMALIEYDRRTPGNNLLCGGALISGRYVLTAAHCIGAKAIETIGRPKLVRLGEHNTDNEGPDCVKVAAGGLDCNTGAVRMNIEQLIPHPDYTASSKRNDIGLIRLAAMAPFTEFIRPICLPTSDITLNPPPAENFTLYVAGWGRTSDYQSSSNVKLHVGLPYVDLQQCQRSYLRPPLRVNLWESQLCAGGQPGKDSCKGDSGGPLMYENGRIFELLGIVNFGPTPCAQVNTPGVYAKVFAYRDWITSNLRS